MWSGQNKNQRLQTWGHGPSLEKGGLPAPGLGWIPAPSAGESRGLVHELMGGGINRRVGAAAVVMWTLYQLY